MNARRAEAFSDGVFAVAITLLIFNVEIPKVGPSELGHALLSAWPAYATYVASFLTIGVMWLNHHRIFSAVRRANRALLLLNLVLLMFIAFLPFPTAVLGRYLGGGVNAVAAAIAYSVTMTLIAIAFQALWLYLALHAEELGRGLTRRDALALAPRFGIGIFIYAASIVLALFSPLAVVALYAVLAVYYAFEQLPVGSEADDESETEEVED